MNRTYDEWSGYYSRATKEQLIEEIERKLKYLIKKLSISDLEELINKIDKAIKKINYIEEIINILEDWEGKND